ncbi:MAG TPA: hypothetical protein PKL83_05400, partial [bacterium]|nr:hypothetical protein [bacterium]
MNWEKIRDLLNNKGRLVDRAVFIIMLGIVLISPRISNNPTVIWLLGLVALFVVLAWIMPNMLR